jgi:hypothetical protein
METKTDKTPTIRSYYNPSDEEKKTIQRVYQRKKDMEMGTDRSEAAKNWDKWRKQWEACREPVGDDWQSNHYVPMTTAVVESILAEVVDQTPRPIIMARGREDVPRATVMRHAFEYSWEIADSDLAAFDIYQEMLICGTAIGQEYYWKQPRTIRHIKPDQTGDKEEEIFDFDDCYLEHVKLEDFYVDENAHGFTGPMGARDCIRRYIMELEDFKNFFVGDFWDGLKNAKYVKPGGDTNYYEWYKPPTGVSNKDKVEVLWYWGKYPKDALTIVANDVLMVDGPNPYHHKQLPFARAYDIKRTHRFYAKGESEILESIQDEKNKIRRMIIDRNHLDIDKMFFVSNRSSLDESDLIARPHGMIPVDDPNSAKAIEYGDIPRSVDLSLRSLDEEGVIVTGVDPRFTSAPSAGTATQAAIIKETAIKRIKMKMRLIEKSFLVEVARLRVANIIQFYSQPKLEKIVGDKASSIYQAEIARLKAKNLLLEDGGEMYRKKYRDLRLENKMLDFNSKGNVVETPTKGYTFFEALPDTFVPLARGGFDIKFEAGATLPVSKPLQQTKASEMYDRLIMNKAFDPQKLGDLLLDVNDYDPDDYHVQSEGDAQGTEQGDADQANQLIKLAMDENKMMSQGQEIPPTPMSSPAHTRLHIAFLQSDQGPKDPKVLQLFANHVMGELTAQSQRQGMGGEAGAGDAATGAVTANESGEGLRQGTGAGKSTAPTLSDLVPNQVSGGGNMPAQA